MMADEYYCGNGCGSVVSATGGKTLAEWKDYCDMWHKGFPGAWAQGEIRITSETGGQKGQKNVRIHGIPWEALEELGRVYAYGEDKYDDYNFRKGYAWSLTFDAMQRHLWAFWNRTDYDEESGRHHLAHAAWHALTLLFFSLTGRGTDDRPN